MNVLSFTNMLNKCTTYCAKLSLSHLESSIVIASSEKYIIIAL